MGLKKCPHCGGEQFYATLMREAIVTVSSDNKIEVVKNSPVGERFEVYECANENCKKKINNASLVDASSVKCKVCGETVSAEDVDENGVCSACRAISNSGKSPMELLRELLGPSNATPAQTPVAPTATTEPTVEEKPKRKKVSRKKKEETPVEIPTENTSDDATEEPAGFMNAPKEEDDDEVPFPDFDDTGFKEEEKPKAPAVEEKPAPPTSNAKFSMYDDDEDEDDDEDDDEEYDDDDDEQF